MCTFQYSQIPTIHTIHTMCTKHLLCPEYCRILNTHRPLWNNIVLKTGGKLSRAGWLAELDYPVAVMSKPAQADQVLSQLMQQALPVHDVHCTKLLKSSTWRNMTTGSHISDQQAMFKKAPCLQGEGRKRSSDLRVSCRRVLLLLLRHIGLLSNGANEGWQRYCNYVHVAVHQLVLHQMGHPYHDPHRNCELFWSFWIICYVLI